MSWTNYFHMPIIETVVLSIVSFCNNNIFRQKYYFLFSITKLNLKSE